MPTHDLVLTDWAVLGIGRRAPDGLGNVLGVREERDLRAPLNQVRPEDLETWRPVEALGLSVCVRAASEQSVILSARSHMASHPFCTRFSITDGCLW
ncbi:hypothetical protein DPX16_21008 [Anabarilius grahami]|uniref:Uncharacterized protein n=1 Tax=Anabarilius grahami TaxID=495550 RepID=A0A3N0YWS0_ANAGA|nr:hypothetical protein DPX16_21008 [Anabarilius grahami]